MKKLLLILALLAYVAVSCDKPETKNVDEPTAVDTSADTCKIYIRSERVLPATMVYGLSSEDIDWDASVNSMFRHFTITLKDGSLAQSIKNNCTPEYEATFDSGRINGCKTNLFLDSLKYGDYVVVMTHRPYSWGPNHYNPKQVFFYHNITLNETHTYDSSTYIPDRYIDSLVDWYDPLWFYEL